MTAPGHAGRRPAEAVDRATGLARLLRELFQADRFADRTDVAKARTDMTKIHLLTGALLLALAPLALAQTPGAPAKKLYCWNENGRKVCGDALPANAVDSARTEISAKSGLATGRVDRALSAEERAAAAAAGQGRAAGRAGQRSPAAPRDGDGRVLRQRGRTAPRLRTPHLAERRHGQGIADGRRRPAPEPAEPAAPRRRSRTGRQAGGQAAGRRHPPAARRVAAAAGHAGAAAARRQHDRGRVRRCPGALPRAEGAIRARSNGG